MNNQTPQDKNGKYFTGSQPDPRYDSFSLDTNTKTEKAQTASFGYPHGTQTASGYHGQTQTTQPTYNTYGTGNGAGYGTGYGTGTGAGYGTGYGYGAATHVTNVYESKPFHEDYFNKKIENGTIKRTEALGSMHTGYTEFDDYFEKHVEKFFTPEISDITLYHHEGYIFGLQLIYRDSWGKTFKETYKGDLHMAHNVDKAHCKSSKFTLAYDENITEINVEGTEYITFLKFVTNKGQVLEVGKQMFIEHKNVVPPHGRVLGIGGQYNVCLNGIYFYYM
jgi:hypothetical protein